MGSLRYGGVSLFSKLVDLVKAVLSICHAYSIYNSLKVVVEVSNNLFMLRLEA